MLFSEFKIKNSNDYNCKRPVKAIIKMEIYSDELDEINKHQGGKQ